MTPKKATSKTAKKSSAPRQSDSVVKSIASRSGGKERPVVVRIPKLTGSGKKNIEIVPTLTGRQRSRTPNGAAAESESVVVTYKSARDPSPDQVKRVHEVVESFHSRVMREVAGLIRVAVPRGKRAETIKQLDDSLEEWDVAAEGTVSLPTDHDQ